MAAPAHKINTSIILSQGQAPWHKTMTQPNVWRRIWWRKAMDKHRSTNHEEKIPIYCRWCSEPDYFTKSEVASGRVNSIFHCCNKPDCIREDKRQEGSHPHDELDNILHLKEIYDAIPLDQESW